MIALVGVLEFSERKDHGRSGLILDVSGRERESGHVTGSILKMNRLQTQKKEEGIGKGRSRSHMRIQEQEGKDEIRI